MYTQINTRSTTCVPSKLTVANPRSVPIKPPNGIRESHGKTSFPTHSISRAIRSATNLRSIHDGLDGALKSPNPVPTSNPIPIQIIASKLRATRRTPWNVLDFLLHRLWMQHDALQLHHLRVEVVQRVDHRRHLRLRLLRLFHLPRLLRLRLLAVVQEVVEVVAYRASVSTSIAKKK